MRKTVKSAERLDGLHNQKAVKQLLNQASNTRTSSKFCRILSGSGFMSVFPKYLSSGLAVTELATVLRN